MVNRIELPQRLAPREESGHKGTYGTVVVVAGSEGMLGAAILAARGALRGGAGLVRAALPSTLMAPFTVAVPAATTVDRDAGRAAMCERAAAVVCGPGLPEGARELVSAIRSQCAAPMVLDAGALQPSELDAPAGDSAVLTPHPAEAGRLLGMTTAQVQADREAAVLALVERFGCSVVLKGAGTLVCDGERLFENETGNPGLGTGGTGDVLAGLIGALISQGMPAFEAACYGVHVHGAAGDLVASRLSQAGLCAEDLPLAIAEVLA